MLIALYLCIFCGSLGQTLLLQRRDRLQRQEKICIFYQAIASTLVRNAS
ncbi:MAG: hypothetical protein KME32_12440 [Mojavia pulchra JT2-VF2]|uniref:Uncharacterized protein n=1 Tax=Mojavia pulchra JT2-VF2 TaxID=287848 RepID=A0A951PYR8_9NOST|nr:hypothetical protein [Mojavia pulchra JT2-VF2]